jgi:hypothetical protein
LICRPSYKAVCRVLAGAAVFLSPGFEVGVGRA